MNDIPHPVAIITGAGSGIGFSIAQTLAGVGYRLALVGRRETMLDETRRQISGEAIVISSDVGDPAQPAMIVKRTIDAFGRVDALINNAAICPAHDIHDVDEQDLHATFEVDLFGPMRLVSALWPVFCEQQGGCVVNISSVATIDPFPTLGMYAAAKSGLESLTRSIHNEGAERGIRAFSIAPGAVETAMLRTIVTEEQLPPESTLAPEDIAKVVVDCVQGQRNQEMGKTIVVNSS